MLFRIWRAKYLGFTIVFEIYMRYSHASFIRFKVEYFQHIVKILKRIVSYCLQSIQCSCCRTFACNIRNSSDSRTILDNIDGFTLCVIIVEVSYNSICAIYRIFSMFANITFLQGRRTTLQAI